MAKKIPVDTRTPLEANIEELFGQLKATAEILERRLQQLPDEEKVRYSIVIAWFNAPGQYKHARMVMGVDHMVRGIVEELRDILTVRNQVVGGRRTPDVSLQDLMDVLGHERTGGDDA